MPVPKEPIGPTVAAVVWSYRDGADPVIDADDGADTTINAESGEDKASG